MTSKNNNPTRALAIDPTSKGFGFVVLEGEDLLVDWGTRTCRGGDKEARCLAAVMELFGQYDLDVLVLEDYTERGFRRCARVRTLLRRVATLAIRANVRIRFIPRSRIYRALVLDGASSKGAMARAIVTRFPELAPRLPPLRRPWMSEDERMAIFDATALALAALAPGVRPEVPPA